MAQHGSVVPGLGKPRKTLAIEGAPVTETQPVRLTYRGGSYEPAELQLAPGPVRVGFRRLTQGNLCLGMPGVSRTHPDRWALDLLTAVLGDGMSSRLFLELRERRSLAYDIGTFATSYADCGTVGIHAGFDPPQATAVIRAALDQLERVVQDPIPQAEVDRAKAYTRGRIELRLEESSAVAAWLGTGASLLPRILTVDQVV